MKNIVIGILCCVAVASAFNYRRFDNLIHCNRFITSSLTYRESIPIDSVKTSRPSGYVAKLDFTAVSNGDFNIGFTNSTDDINIEVVGYNDIVKVIFRCEENDPEVEVEYAQKQPLFIEFSLTNDGLITIREQNNKDHILQTKNQCKNTDLKYFDFAAYDNITAEYYYNCPKNDRNLYEIDNKIENKL